MGLTDLTHYLEQFSLAAENYKIREVNKGHINDTYHLVAIRKGDPDYILQKVNHHVFKDVPAVMQNFFLVGEHLNEKYTGLISLRCFPTRKGEYFYIDQQGNYWRLLNYIPHATSLENLNQPDQAYQVGLAYGAFVLHLNDLPIEKIQTTIPDFHNVEKRINKLEQVFESLPAASKSEEVIQIYDFILMRAGELTILDGMRKHNELPLRITHNDTKFNNILLDEYGHPVAVVDLDTVMPGLVHYDFGDAIRTISNNTREDDPELEKIEFSFPLFRAFSQGFLEKTLPILTKKELMTLPAAVKIFPYLMGIRFFTDYLQGNIYYKVSHPLQNLHRANNQFTFLQKIEKNYALITRFLHDFLHNSKT